MRIDDPQMLKKMAQALGHGDDLYTLDDIEDALLKGEMQGHVEGNTWAITQVQEFPRRKVVHILFVIGEMRDLPKLEGKIQVWARDLGATMLTAVGRDKWWVIRTPGWRTTGTAYAKDI